MKFPYDCDSTGITYYASELSIVYSIHINMIVSKTPSYLTVSTYSRIVSFVYNVGHANLKPVGLSTMQDDLFALKVISFCSPN